jgi:hypothetical protein
MYVVLFFLLQNKNFINLKNEDKEEIEPEVLIVEEINYGLRVQDLQEQKDKLLVETSDMLQCSLFEAELLLKKHSWSKEVLLHSWIDDQNKCYEKCGVIVLPAPEVLQIIDNNDKEKLCYKEVVFLIFIKIYFFHQIFLFSVLYA